MISVDTGNRCIKVPDIAPFTAGLYCSGNVPPAAAADVIEYQSNFYTLSEERCTYQRDKTVNINYFILVLFAMAKRIIAKQPGRQSYKKEVILSLGLPPAHCKQELKDKYRKYFSNGGEPIRFVYNDIPFCITIAYPADDSDRDALKDPCLCGVLVYVQGLAAASLKGPEIQQYPESYVIDIGGYTTDIIRLSRKQTSKGYRLEVDPAFCVSLNSGVIHLYNNIKRAVSESVDDGISETIIDAIMQGNYRCSDKRVNEIIAQSSEEYAKNMMADLIEKGVNLRFSHPVFVGGGTSVLQKYLLAACPQTDITIIPQLTANAEGYAKMTSAVLMQKGVLVRPQEDTEDSI